MLAPIVLFVYNRPWHTKQVLDALADNPQAKDSMLFVYCDGPKQGGDESDKLKLEEVWACIRQETRFREISVKRSEINKGLAASIVDGVTEIVNEYGKVIVLEDDIVTSPGFLKFMNDALDLYAQNNLVMHISGYMFPVNKKLPSTFFYNTASCWGWGTWKRAWRYYISDTSKIYCELIRENSLSKFDIDDTADFSSQLIANMYGRLNSWAVKWYGSIHLNSGYSLHPYPSLTQNIGVDGSGTNSGISSKFVWPNLANDIKVAPIRIKPSTKAWKAMKEFYSVVSPKAKGWKDLVRPIYRRLKKIRSNMFAPTGLESLLTKQRFKFFEIEINKKKYWGTDGISFYYMYIEIFKSEIYRFSTLNQEPYILDVGANIGLSVLYYKNLYPKAEIVAFEPDKRALAVLKKHIYDRKFDNVQIIEKGVWDSETILQFFHEGADAGRLARPIDKEAMTEVPVVSLRPWINRDVDFLKIDIEGAEYTVLKDIQDLLFKVNRIFVEFHSFVDEQQNLSEILSILKSAGFRVYIQQAGIKSVHPFQRRVSYYNMDLQLNIFGYRLLESG